MNVLLSLLLSALSTVHPGSTSGTNGGGIFSHAPAPSAVSGLNGGGIF